MHMLVENATSRWGQSWERVFHKHSCIQFIALVPKLVLPKIVPMAKLDIWNPNVNKTLLCPLQEDAVITDFAKYKLLKCCYFIAL